MTTARILLHKPGATWNSPASTSYAGEDALQTPLDEAPELPPWAGPTGVVVARELQVPLTGPLQDHPAVVLAHRVVVAALGHPQ
jgi:hypothetical protein